MPFYLIPALEEPIGDDGVVHLGLEGPEEALLAERVARLGAAQCGEGVARRRGTLGPGHRLTSKLDTIKVEILLRLSVNFDFDTLFHM